MKPSHLLYASRIRWMVVTAITFTALWLFAGNSTPALAATTWTVTTLTDRNNASCVAGDCSLREAIKSANAGAGGDAINFASGLNGTLLLTIGALPNIGKSVTIDGGRVITISGLNSTRLFFVNTGVMLTLTSIILENGNSGSDYGGAIYVDHGTLILNNSTIQNSQTNNFSGGAIVNFSGAVTLNNSIVQGNTGYSFGAISSSGIVTLTNNSIVRNNTATMGAGGFSVGGTVTINNSQIYSNTASSENGGGLRILSGAQVSINNSQIYSNHANSGSGGGIENGGVLTVTQSTFSGNSANVGGGIDNFIATTTLTNMTLSGNSATLAGGGISNNIGTTTLTNVTLSGNSAPGGGGGIYHYSNIAGKTITLKNTIVANSPSGGNCENGTGSPTNIASSGFNLSNDNSCTPYFTQAGDQNNKPAQLGPLANNGGFTLTHIPLPPIVNGSGPIDNGTCVVSTDQRGVMRPQGAACDIGAVEYRILPALWLPLIVR